MESTRNPLPPILRQYFADLKQYINLPIYFYGSIQREDYYQHESDIDIDVFTENMATTLVQLQHFFKVSRKKFHPFVTRFASTTHVAFGYKLNYIFTRPGHSYPIEIAVYNKNDETAVRSDQNKKANIPKRIAWLLIVIKYLYYKLGIMPKSTFVYLKKQWLNGCVEYGNNDFIKYN